MFYDSFDENQVVLAPKNSSFLKNFPTFFFQKKNAKTGNARHKWAENVILASKCCVTEFRDTSHLFVHDCEKIPHAHNHANVLFWM